MIAIRTDSLGKRYALGLTHAGTLRDVVGGWTARLLGRREGSVRGGQSEVPQPGTDGQERFWAVRDVSVEVPVGEVVGVIGRNGAGKSTLLKLLARITTPTEGRIELRGRVGSLLEVGTGFHPELTGRENIFLGGAILGMTKAEIRRKSEQIVAFAEIDEFLDTPVKRYSSGMYVRLAFAVAAHLEPEILLVDEVLAVGDARFQRKCLGKMRDVSSHGRTIVFVSHNMDAVKRLCRRVIWLDHGKVRYQGPAGEGVARYLLAEVSENGHVRFRPPLRLANGMPLGIHAIEVADSHGRPRSRLSAGKPIHVRIEWELFGRLYKPRIGFVLHTADASEVFTALDANSWKSDWLETGRYASSCTIPAHLLNEGSYVVCLSGDAPGKHDFQSGLTAGLVQFEVEDDMTLPNKYYGEEGFRDARWPGAILPNLAWVQSRLDDPLA